MDHFALPNDELVNAQDSGRLQRNFMGYTAHAGCDLLGLGVSAISHLGNCCASQLVELETDRLVWVCASRIIATPKGRYLLRVIADCFDRYPEESQTRQRGDTAFSKVV
jgi:coproporphyrinogen III oxidase-like Fe-S oxidoreductase